jgi:hypothetical protein
MNITSNHPKLIESTTKYYLQEKLRQCHNIRADIYSTIINVSVITFFFIFGGYMLYCIYNNKPTEEELREKNIINQHIIMNKIKEFRTVPAKITDLTETAMFHPAL